MSDGQRPAFLVTALAAALFAAVAVVLVALRPLMPIDETRYLAVAWEMWQGGSKFVPHLNGDLYSHKPPLLFWLINAVWSVTGVNETAARLVGPAFGLASVALTAVLARTLWPTEAARAGQAALILATTGVFLFFGSTTMFDAMLTTAVLGAMIALWRLRTGGGLWPVLGLGLALSLGVYAKGPVVLLHVLPVALLMPLWAEAATRPALGAWYGRIGLALVLALALTGLWLGPALVIGGAEYRADVLWRQSAGRMVESFAHKRPIWFFLALMPVFLWPWGWGRGAISGFSPRNLRADAASRLVMIWALGAVIGFSLVSGKQMHYLLPELPALALLLAAGWQIDRSTRLWRFAVLIPVLVIFGLGCLIALGLGSGTRLAAAAVPLGSLAAGAGVLVVLVAVLVWVHQDRWAMLAVAPGALIMAHLLAAPMLAGAYSADIIGRWLASHEAQGIALTDQVYHGEFTFAGRLTQPVSILIGADAIAAWVDTHTGGAILSQNDLVDQRLELTGMQTFRGKDYRLYQVRELSQ